MTFTHDLRLAAIAESDRRWPDYLCFTAHAKSGGFIDGVEWAHEHPNDDVIAEADRRFVLTGDETRDLVTGWWRDGFLEGVKWQREHGKA